MEDLQGRAEPGHLFREGGIVPRTPVQTKSRQLTMAKSDRDGKSHVFSAFSAVWTVICTILVPWQSMYGPVQSLLQADNHSKDSLTDSWKDKKLAELTFVGLTVWTVVIPKRRVGDIDNDIGSIDCQRGHQLFLVASARYDANRCRRLLV
jgi:hypothetical protein